MQDRARFIGGAAVVAVAWHAPVFARVVVPIRGSGGRTDADGSCHDSEGKGREGEGPSLLGNTVIIC